MEWSTKRIFIETECRSSMKRTLNFSFLPFLRVLTFLQQGSHLRSWVCQNEGHWSFVVNWVRAANRSFEEVVARRTLTRFTTVRCCPWGSSIDCGFCWMLLVVDRPPVVGFAENSFYAMTFVLFHPHSVFSPFHYAYFLCTLTLSTVLYPPFVNERNGQFIGKIEEKCPHERRFKLYLELCLILEKSCLVNQIIN